MQLFTRSDLISLHKRTHTLVKGDICLLIHLLPWLPTIPLTLLLPPTRFEFGRELLRCTLLHCLVTTVVSVGNAHTSMSRGLTSAFCTCAWPPHTHFGEALRQGGPKGPQSPTSAAIPHSLAAAVNGIPSVGTIPSVGRCFIDQSDASHARPQ